MIIKNKSLCLPCRLFFTLLSIFSFLSPASPIDEINHLLYFVEVSDCTYERNGTFHKGSAEVKHINKKYHSFADDISSAEDFIKRSATKSTL